MHDVRKGSSFARPISILLSSVTAAGLILWCVLSLSAFDQAPGGDAAQRAAVKTAKDRALEIATNLQARLGEDGVKPALAEPDRNSQAPRFMSQSSMQLVGVMRMGEAPRALIRTVAEDQGNWISVGEIIQGWRVRQITQDSAVMERQGRLERLRLSDARAIERD